jgi:hypothetical protein
LSEKTLDTKAGTPRNSIQADLKWNRTIASNRHSKRQQCNRYTKDKHRSNIEEKSNVGFTQPAYI